MNEAYVPLITKILYVKMFGKLETTKDFDLWQYQHLRVLNSSKYNYLFDSVSGEFWRWGKTLDDDPQFSPFGPEIADVEISVGDCSGRCPFCYKSNTPNNGKHMTVETFEQVLDKMPSVMQVALGLTDLDSNPDLEKILQACRVRGVVPNFTTAGFTQEPRSTEWLENILSYVGAVAVSVYPHTVQKAYETVWHVSRYVKQTNIHLLYHQDNLAFVYQVLRDIKADWRLANLNAVVLLGLKPKGRGKEFVPLNQHGFTHLVNYAVRNDIPIGFDSCSAHKFLNARKNLCLPKELDTYAEPCESGLFSIYVDSNATVWPCSFTEERTEPLDILQGDFLKDVWNSPTMNQWREKLLANGRKCPEYEID